MKGAGRCPPPEEGGDGGPPAVASARMPAVGQVATNIYFARSGFWNWPADRPPCTPRTSRGRCHSRRGSRRAGPGDLEPLGEREAVPPPAVDRLPAGDLAQLAQAVAQPRLLRASARPGPAPQRWFPVAMLGVAAASAGLFSALAGRLGGSHGSFLGLIPVTLAVYAVVTTSARRTALAAVGTAVAALEVVAAGSADGTVVLSAPALAAVGWLAAENVRTRRAYAHGMAERAAEHARELARRAGAEERVRIARELHDVVAHAMSIIAVRSGVARMALDVRPEEAREALGIIEGTSRQALQEITSSPRPRSMPTTSTRRANCSTAAPGSGRRSPEFPATERHRTQIPRQ